MRTGSIIFDPLTADPDTTEDGEQWYRTDTGDLCQKVGEGIEVSASKADILATKLDDFAAPEDNTDLDTSTGSHGLCPKLDNSSTHYLNGQGAWATPAGGGGSVYAATISAWTSDSGLYRADVTHSLGTNDVIVQGFLTSNNKNVGFEEIERTDTNTVRIWVAIEENVRIVVSSASGVGGPTVPSYSFDAGQLLSPNSSDWAVNALAPLSADSNNVGLVVRLFDDTIEEGVGFIVKVPSGVTNLKIHPRARAETAPAGARTVGLKLYNRGLPDNGAVESWSAGTVLDDIDVPVNEYFQYDEQTIALSTLGITAGELTQFELTRVNPQAGTELVGDWALIHLGLEFT